MKINPAEKSPKEMYQFLISAIVPRPIAWVSTVSSQGITNLAPYSFFNGVTAKPPTLVFSPVNDRHGNKKDTVVNIEETNEFVVNIVHKDICEQMIKTSYPYESSLSEFAECGVTEEKSEIVAPPRVKDARISMECSLHQIVTVGEGPLAANLVIGKIEFIHLDDAILDDEGSIAAEKLCAVGRMGGSLYLNTSDLFVG